MKAKIILLGALPLSLLFSCNNEASDTVEKADSINQEKLDSSSTTTGQTITTDAETTDFLVKAADGGMAEVETSTVAQQKATNARVKDFASMMVNDHTGANGQVKTLAAQRNVTLPTAPGDDKKKKLDDLNAKSGASFDKDYMRLMVDDHQNTIDLFENASGKVNDAEVKTFIDNTLPKLRAHLDSAKSVQKALK